MKRAISVDCDIKERYRWSSQLSATLLHGFKLSNNGFCLLTCLNDAFILGMAKDLRRESSGAI